MPGELSVNVGALRLKNPLIAGAAEHLIEETGVRRALAAGAAVVVMKSTNEVEAAKAQLDAAEYAVFDETLAAMRMERIGSCVRLHRLPLRALSRQLRFLARECVPARP